MTGVTVFLKGGSFSKGTRLEIHDTPAGPSTHSNVYMGTLRTKDGRERPAVVKTDYASAPHECHGIEEEHRNAALLKSRIKSSSSLSPQDKAFMLSKFCFPICYRKGGDGSSGMDAFMVFPYGGASFVKALRRDTVPASVFLSAYKEIGIVLALLHELGMAYGDLNALNALVNDDGELVLVDLATVSERPEEFLSWYQKEDVLRWLRAMPYVLEDEFPRLRDAKERFVGEGASSARRDAPSTTISRQDLLGLVMNLLEECCGPQNDD